jgi:hypothetical protein
MHLVFINIFKQLVVFLPVIFYKLWSCWCDMK